MHTFYGRHARMRQSKSPATLPFFFYFFSLLKAEWGGTYKKDEKPAL